MRFLGFKGATRGDVFRNTTEMTRLVLDLCLILQRMTLLSARQIRSLPKGLVLAIATWRVRNLRKEGRCWYGRDERWPPQSRGKTVFPVLIAGRKASSELPRQRVNHLIPLVLVTALGSPPQTTPVCSGCCKDISLCRDNNGNSRSEFTLARQR